MEPVQLLSCLLDESLFKSDNAAITEVKGFNGKKASVALLCRVSSTGVDAIGSLAGLKRDDVIKLIKEQTLPTELTIEILLMQRAVHESDPWSGDVAFPGGKCDDGESLQDAVFREVLEEVGINLSDETKFMCLGTLSAKFMKSRKGRMLVVPFLFICFQEAPYGMDSDNSQLNNHLTIVPNKDEVARAWWHDITSLHGSIVDRELGVSSALCYGVTGQRSSRSSRSVHALDMHNRFLTSVAKKSRFKYMLLLFMQSALWVKHVLFPCIYLSVPPPPGVHQSSQSLTDAAMNCTAHHGVVSPIFETDLNSSPQSELLPLWGMTYSILCDLLLECSYHREATITATASPTASPIDGKSLNDEPSEWEDKEGRATKHCNTNEVRIDSSSAATITGLKSAKEVRTGKVLAFNLDKLREQLVHHQYILVDNRLLSLLIVIWHWLLRHCLCMQQPSKRNKVAVICGSISYLIMIVAIITIVVGYMVARMTSWPTLSWEIVGMSLPSKLTAVFSTYSTEHTEM